MNNQNPENQASEKSKFAIRFALGAIKAVGIGSMEEMVKERQENGKFKDIYDFAERIDNKLINKKSIEALSKAGAFDKIHNNRRQIAESFDIISSYSQEKNNAKSSNQMSFFGATIDDSKPALKKVNDWQEFEKLQNEFEAFGFFLNSHPLDSIKIDLQKRGVIFSDKLQKDELQDNDIIKIAGVVVSTKHRSGSRGRFAYINLSDIFSVFEMMIFDENLITEARDLIADGSQVVIEANIRKDEGGTRMSVKKITALNDFINNTKPRNDIFADIQKGNNYKKFNNDKNYNNQNSYKANNHNISNHKLGNNNQQINNNSQNNEEIILEKIIITIKEREVLFSLKAFLQQRIIANYQYNQDNKYSQIIIAVENNNGELVKISLADYYKITNNDILKIKKIPKIINIEY